MSSLRDILTEKYDIAERKLPPTPGQVREIRKLYATGSYRQIDLAESFGISQPEVSRIVNRKRRKDVE